MVQTCPAFLSTGLCQDQNCRFKHDAFTCEPCGLVLSTEAECRSHLQGRRHLKSISGKYNHFLCPICDISVVGYNWSGHVISRRHRRAASKQGLLPGIERPDEPSAPPEKAGTRLCNMCNLNIPEAHWSEHPASRRHRRAERFLAYKAVHDEATKDKHGITVSDREDGVDFSIVELADATTGVVRELMLQTTVPISRIPLVDVKWSSALSSSRTSPAYFALTMPTLPVRLMYGSPTRISITLRQTQVGRYEDRLEMTFRDPQLEQRFVIVRSVKAIVGSKADYDMLKPKAPYVPRIRGARSEAKKIIEGIRPPSLNAVKWVVKLPKADMPKDIMSIVSTGSVAEIVGQLQRTALPRALTAETYSRHFKVLLWVEEYRMEFDLGTYDIPNASLTKHGLFFRLEVPGLAEKRPSVLTGDRMLVQRHGEEVGKWFEGHVHFVREKEVGLRFHGSFPAAREGGQHHVRFRLNRIPVRRQHQALDSAFMSDRILFPIQSHVKALEPLATPMTVKNSLIATNQPQMRAIKAIVALPPGSPPFVLFGPPGTGKTVTIVEAIWQILKKDPSARILACAPSNSAADLIASKLMDLGPEQLFRFYAPSRAKIKVPTELLPFTHVRDDLPVGDNEYSEDVQLLTEPFSHPPIIIVRKFRVIVSTCVSACFAFGIGVPRGHFTHVFIDEAGQATEPEAMIPIKTMADLKTNVVLSGDPKQLGPIIRSAVARRLELDISYMERLLGRDPYKRENGDGTTMVKLIKNYRSHNAILRYPNERFYDGELEPCGNPRTINSYIGSPLLVSKRFPIVFHGMAGKDAREASSPSFFNVEEVLQVKAYVQQLKADRTTDADIGIVAPYHAQCKKIRAALRGMADEIKIGSVEEFQGQERKVIIMSTVRSSQDYVEYDLKHTLGFVANPRRFNDAPQVAVTRAQALLIIVGDPTVLSLDPLWRSFLNYVHNNHGWKGAAITWDPNEPVREDGGYDAEIRARGEADMNDLAQRVQNATLQNVAANADVEEAEANEDRPWREVE